MKIVIDVPDNKYQWIKDNPLTYDNEYCEAIRNGTPLDKIRAEIERQEKWLLQAGCTAYNVDIALDAIKSAVTGSEG